MTTSSNRQRILMYVSDSQRQEFKESNFGYSKSAGVHLNSQGTFAISRSSCRNISAPAEF